MRVSKWRQRNIGSLEIRASTYISAKCKKHTYTYKSLQFPVETNTRGSKTPNNFYSFSHKVWFAGPQFRLIKPNFRIITWGILCYEFIILTSCEIWKLILLNVSLHIQLHMHEFSDSVGLLGSLRDTALHLSDEELWYEPRETTVQPNSSNPHKEVKMAQLHQQMRFNITFAFVNIIG